MKFIDATGQKFGKLTVVSKVEHKTGRRTLWNCKCECGNTCKVSIANLRNGHTRSCGCMLKESNTRHGHWGTRVYQIYYAMKQRCYNPNNAAYWDYGERGITICDEWLNDFESFYKWSIENGYSDDLTIDRIDPQGNYEPSNCRWADRYTQGYNQRKSTKNTSGTVGVSKRKDTGKYQAYITKNGKTIKLGSYKTIEEAIQARKEAEIKYYGTIKE